MNRGTRNPARSGDAKMGANERQPSTVTALGLVKLRPHSTRQELRCRVAFFLRSAWILEGLWQPAVAGEVVPVCTLCFWTFLTAAERGPEAPRAFLRYRFGRLDSGVASCSRTPQWVGTLQLVRRLCPRLLSRWAYAAGLLRALQGVPLLGSPSDEM